MTKVAKSLYSHIDNYKELLFTDNINKKIAVAVSGGIDSMSLMIVAKDWCIKNNVSLVAITVDHGLRENSRKEADYVADLCKQYDIEHYILTWEGEKPTNNLESIARENRYKLISNFCKKNDISILLVAHHLQDQAETFFIRLFRGSGIDGLSSIKNITSMYGLKILRPFLEVPKEELQMFLEENNIKWVEDESNNNDKFLRNKIRKFLNSFDDKENILNRINSAVENINDSRLFIDSVIKKIEKTVVSFNSFGTCLIDKDKLIKQDSVISFKILSSVCMKISGNIYKPRLKKLVRLFDNIKENDNIKYTFYGCVFESYKDNLIMVYREYNSILEDKLLIFNEEIIWDNRFKLVLKKKIDGLIATHVKDGEFNGILNSFKINNIKKYREMKDISGIEKRIFYTLPVIKSNNEYILDQEFVSIDFI